jgi:hypothetical protein
MAGTLDSAFLSSIMTESFSMLLWLFSHLNRVQRYGANINGGGDTSNGPNMGKGRMYKFPNSAL